MQILKFNVLDLKKKKLIKWYELIKMPAEKIIDYLFSDNPYYIRMQFSGFLDKYGEEIYEYDYITMDIGDGEKQPNFLVLFEEGCYVLDGWMRLKNYIEWGEKKQNIVVRLKNVFDDKLMIEKFLKSMEEENE